MALAASPHQTYIPLPSSNSGGLVTLAKIIVHFGKWVGLFLGIGLADEPSVRFPLCIYSNDLASSLVPLSPSALRYGTLCIVQFAFLDAIYLVDAIRGGKKLLNACKPALESVYVTKVIHDCQRDSEALYYQFGIKLHNVMDTQIAYYLIEEQLGKKSAPYDHISFVHLLADPRYCEFLNAERDTLEEEILSVLDVPPGKMGRFVGRKGSSILSIKESCKAEILIGGSKGEADKVFIIGPLKQVRKAEAILRGRML
ncbi:hypothetical protein HAX54_016871 [Datura stramonium]|uniref:K Homology domain-containing protein n=1 Tax=Datura stramonium TaxID=4076 RepID=A0ABS8RIY7_DATST|nr:hypothetical protein [Datura stramonium]